MRNQRGEVFILGIIGLAVVGGLFVAYVTGHPLPWNKNEFQKVQTVDVVPPSPVRVPPVVEQPVVVDAEPEIAAAVANT